MDYSQNSSLPQRKRPRLWRRWVVLPVCVALFVLLGAGNQIVRTPKEALALLLETYSMPEDAILIETEDFLGWYTPFEPLGGDESPDAQQCSTQLCYWRLTPNEKYYEFWVYSALLDVPSTGEGHCSTLNFYAVSRGSGEILIQRTDAGMEGRDAYMDAITR